MLLPVFVLMGVRIIVDTANNDARKVVHQSSCLHLDAENIHTKPLAKCVPEGGILDDLVTGRDQAACPGLSLYYLGLIAEPTALFFLVHTFSITTSPILVIRNASTIYRVLVDVAILWLE